MCNAHACEVSGYYELRNKHVAERLQKIPEGVRLFPRVHFSWWIWTEHEKQSSSRSHGNREQKDEGKGLFVSNSPRVDVAASLWYQTRGFFHVLCTCTHFVCLRTYLCVEQCTYNVRMLSGGRWRVRRWRQQLKKKRWKWNRWKWRAKRRARKKVSAFTTRSHPHCFPLSAPNTPRTTAQIVLTYPPLTCT